MQGFISVVSRATLSFFVFILVILSLAFSRGVLHAQTTVEELVTVTAQVGVGSGIGGSGGNVGGGGQQNQPDATVRFQGFAYPSSTVTLLKNNTIVATTIAGANPGFELTLTGLMPGVHTFSLYSQDVKGVLSRPVSVTVMVNGSAITTVSGIIIPPTLDTETSVVQEGDPVVLFGQSAPFAEIEFAVTNQAGSYGTTANSDGLFSYTLDTTSFGNGRVFVTAQANIHGAQSQLSVPIGLTIQSGGGGGGVPGWILRGDVNKDNRVNLVDLTIIKSWHRRSLNATMRALENERLSGDSVIDLTDFSIAAYYWTG